MPVPTYPAFIEPILRFLDAHPAGAPAKEAHDAAADALGVDEESRAERLPSGIQRVYKNRAGWAHDRLKRAGLSSSPRRGVWQLTEAGRAFLREHPGALDAAAVEDLATGYNNVRLGKKSKEDAERPEDAVGPADPGLIAASPDDRLEQALSELKDSVSEELLELLSRVSPDYFETIVLDLLHRMGYGTSRADLKRVGKSGDEGIDGVISLDRLGLERVYVQAKRWQSTVGRPEVQGFFGALAGQRANKGVFITTSNYSKQAVDFAKSVERIVLVGGERLAELMIEHQVGVTSRAVHVPKIDSDYFEE
jgi:restriction system protein